MSDLWDLKDLTKDPQPECLAMNATTRRSESLLLSLQLSSLELSDTPVYEPSIRVILGTASSFCDEVVLALMTVPVLRQASVVK